MSEDIKVTLNGSTAIMNLNRIKISGAQLEPMMGKGALYIQKFARKYAPKNHGELIQSIMVATEVEGNTSAKGIVYTNKEYAPYVEYGTGPKGAANHSGISPEVSVSYRMTQWMIPYGEIPDSDAERYHMIPVKKNGEIIGWLTYGQAAQPYMYPAIKYHNEGAMKVVAKEVEKYLKGAIK